MLGIEVLLGYAQMRYFCYSSLAHMPTHEVFFPQQSCGAVAYHLECKTELRARGRSCAL